MENRGSSTKNGTVPVAISRLLSVLPSTEMAVHWHALEAGAGPMTLWLLTSLSELRTHRQALWWRLLAVSAGMLLSVGFVVVFFLRQRHEERAIRERLRHAEELNRLKHQLVRAEKLATVGVLSAGIAHEVGTPLAIIRGRAEILNERTSMPELETILEQSDRIANTLRQVLDFVREQPVAVQPIDVLTTFRSLVELLHFRVRQKKLECRIEPESGSFVVAADSDQLQQVLVNLFLNACDACGEGGRIILRAGTDPASPDFVRMEVIDNGCGISADKLDAVFDPFYTTKPKGEGTGLGLPVAAGIVRNHRGQISISSTVGQGTTLTLLWPKDKSTS